MAGLGVNSQGQFADVLSGSYGPTYGIAQTTTLADVPGQDPLKLGPVSFNSRQCPSKLDLGAGDQLVVDTKITGGTRIVQTFGGFYSNVRFTGTFWEDAVAKYAQLDKIRVKGAETTISWAAGRFYGIIIDLKPGARHKYRYDFEVELIITRVAGAQANSAASVDSVVGQASSNAATAYASTVAIDPTASTAIPPALLSNVNASILNAGPLAQTVGTPSGTAIQAAVSSAKHAVSGYLGKLTSLSAAYTSAKVLLNSLALIGKNVSQGSSPRAVQQLGGSFFEAAVTAYGNIDHAFTLADANNSPSLRISNTKLANISLPPLPTSL